MRHSLFSGSQAFATGIVILATTLTFAGDALAPIDNPAWEQGTAAEIDTDTHTVKSAPATRLGERLGTPSLGLVQPIDEVILSAPIDGVLMALPVTEGQFVTAGEALATMDDRVIRASVQLARINAERVGAIQEAEVALANAERIFTRLTSMHERNAVTNTELEDAQMECDRARAHHRSALEAAEVAAAELEMQRQRLESLTIRAPFDGCIVRIWAKRGAAFNIADPILRVVSLESLQAEINVPSTLRDSLNVRQTYSLHADDPVGRSISATLRWVSPVIDPSSRTVRCVFDIPNPDGRLPSGFSVALPPDITRTVTVEPNQSVPDHK